MNGKVKLFLNNLSFVIKILWFKDDTTSEIRDGNT